jgi:hypothetical protein
MMTYLFKMRGADLRPFEKSPAERLYDQQLSVWQSTAALLAKNATFGELKPEDMAKILGPMPTPPPEVQQQMQQPAPSQTAAALESTQS